MTISSTNAFRAPQRPIAPVIGVGSYSAAEAARLLQIPSLNIRRWLAGYRYRKNGAERAMPPLWKPQFEAIDDEFEIGFRDLVELRFVKAFLGAGLTLLTIRHCLQVAADCVSDPRPFSTSRFLTDGKTIFLQSVSQAEGEQLLDLKNKQFVFKRVVERTFRDLDIDDGAVSRWRPFQGKSSIVIDPKRAFGQPIVDEYGITTIALAESAEAEGSIERAAWTFEVTPATVRDAVAYERQLNAA